MTKPSKQVRALVAGALPGVLEGWTYRKGAYRPGDESALPVYEIATPRRDIARDSTDDTAHAITLEIVLRMKGGEDVFDVLDDRAEELEAVVVPLLGAAFEDCDLTRVETAPATDAPQLVGLMVLTFTVRAITSRSDL